MLLPISKERDITVPRLKDTDIDILIATDCISEGQNLQDCDMMVNYDIHWNPVRIIQRFGRIDRIGSTNKRIQLVNYWPDVDLDKYLKLKDRVEARMKVAVMASTGDDDYINPDEKGDLEYRERQLRQMQDEVPDLEDMDGGVSITDLGNQRVPYGLGRLSSRQSRHRAHAYRHQRSGRGRRIPASCSAAQHEQECEGRGPQPDPPVLSCACRR